MSKKNKIDKELNEVCSPRENRKLWFRGFKKFIRLLNVYKKPDTVYLGKRFQRGSLIISNHVGSYRPLSATRAAKGFAPSMQALTALVVLKHDLTRARGGVRLLPMDCHLTFTHHFRLRRSPHWGRVMRKRPLDSPLRSNLDFAWSRPRSNRLAGARHNSMILPPLGAASRGSATQPPAQQAASVGLSGTVTKAPSGRRDALRKRASA